LRYGSDGRLSSLIRTTTPYFRRTSRFEGFNDAFSGTLRRRKSGLFPQPFWWWDISARFLREKTALLAGEAYADSAIVTSL